MARISIFLAFSLMFVLQALCQDCTSHSCLRRLYNSRVTYAEYWTRSLGLWSSSSRKKRSVYHAGVVVTVENGDRWLIHKGLNYGDASSTVITSASYMSTEWSLVKSKSVSGCRYTVNTFMQNALILEPYNLLVANCQTAANQMWELVKGC